MAVVLSLPLSFLSAQPAGELAALVEQHYAAVSTVSAKVTQKSTMKAVGRTQVFDGQLALKKPGKLRIDFSNGQLVMVDGTSALFYSRKSEQMIRKKFADISQMNIPIAFLLGAAHISDDFTVSQSGGDGRSLDLLPKKKTATMKRIGLVCDEAGRITTLVIHDRSDNKTEIVFTDIREGGAIEDKLFAFKPPKGTEIVEQ